MIYGKRIRLRAMEEEDLPLFVVWLNDPEVTMGLSLYLPLSFQDEKAWFESMHNQPQEKHPLMIEVAQDDDWVPVGNCGFGSLDWRVRSAEFGIGIGAKEYWGQGYGSEATKLMLQHGFNTLNLNRIMLRVFDINPRARRVYEKVGYVYEGTMRQAHYYNGEYVDVHFMSVLRDEWLVMHADSSVD